jgi:hypothetical protein
MPPRRSDLQPKAVANATTARFVPHFFKIACCVAVTGLARPLQVSGSLTSRAMAFRQRVMEVMLTSALPQTSGRRL